MIDNFTLLITSAAICILFALLIFFYQWHSSKKASSSQKYSIAILSISKGNVCELLINGFKQELQNLVGGKVEFTYDVYSTKNDRSLLRSYIEDICDKDYDLIFSIGGATTIMTHSITSSKGYLTPIIFTAVNTPVKLGVVESMKSSGNHLTGVTGVSDSGYLERMANFLNIVKPESEKVMILYNPNPTQNSNYLEQEAQELAFHLKNMDKDVSLFHVYHFNEIEEKVPLALTTDIDTLITLSDVTTIRATDTLIKLCNKYNVTFYALNALVVEQGAALGYGIRWEDFGIEAAKLAHKVLCEKMKPTDIPIVEWRTNCKFFVNKKAMEKQGLSIRPESLYLLENTEVIEGV